MRALAEACSDAGGAVFTSLEALGMELMQVGSPIVDGALLLD